MMEFNTYTLFDVYNPIAFLFLIKYINVINAMEEYENDIELNMTDNEN